MLSNVSWISRIAALVFLLSIFTVNWGSLDTDILPLFVAYFLAFVSYLVLINRRDISFSKFAIIAISAQLLSILFEPNLSIDYYRFLWDGEMAWNGINAFDYKPNEVMVQPFLRHNEYMHLIYDGISDISKRNYSCYPTVNQSYFVTATAFSSSIPVNTLILKLIIVLTELIGAIYLFKILSLLKIPTKRLWILFLNPLWIIECTGNTHFEGVMISFLFIAFYFLLKKKVVLGGSWFAIAVQIKLIPLLIVPFFLRYLGWTKMIVFTVLAIGLSTAIGLIHIDSNNIYNFLQSLALYFSAFEFNSIFFYNMVQYGKSINLKNALLTYSPIISQVSIFLVLLQAFWGNSNTWKKVFGRITVAFFIYLILTSTVHPWYILPLLAFSIFTNYSFPIIWSLLIFLSYAIYTIEGGSYADDSRLLISIEYTLVIGVFLYEIIRKKPLISFLALGKDED